MKSGILKILTIKPHTEITYKVYIASYHAGKFLVLHNADSICVHNADSICVHTVRMLLIPLMSQCTHACGHNIYTYIPVVLCL